MLVRENQKDPIGVLLLLEQWVFIKTYGFPGFGPKDPSNPKDGNTKDDAMDGNYSLDAPNQIFHRQKMTSP